MTNLDSVRKFWEENPLWSGESSFEIGSHDFFEEHRQTYISDCFAGQFDLRFLPPPRHNGQNIEILDLGCGIGFWTTEFGLRGLKKIHAADLTQKALEITSQRLSTYGISAELSIQNAELLTFGDCCFDHVNCQGVIHHTPNTETAVSEIARVLKPGGSASISVYHRNSILKMWPYLRWLGAGLSVFGGGLKGRGREKIFLTKDVDQIVRLYDGLNNPIGKSFSKSQFIDMLAKHFEINEVYLHFFPARALPFKIPKFIHSWLDKNVGFMIYASVRKPV